jgi:DNA-binding CsgD family transcriptional regulator
LIGWSHGQGPAARRPETVHGQLTITRRTVEAHISASLNELGLSTRTQIAVWAVEHGLRVADPP